MMTVTFSMLMISLMVIMIQPDLYSMMTHIGPERIQCYTKKAKILLYRIIMVCCEDFEKVGAETRPLGPKKFFFHFFTFFVSFSLSPTCLCISWCFFVGFSFILGQYISCGMSMGHISVFALFAFCSFGRF